MPHRSHSTEYSSTPTPGRNRHADGFSDHQGGPAPASEQVRSTPGVTSSLRTWMSRSWTGLRSGSPEITANLLLEGLEPRLALCCQGCEEPPVVDSQPGLAEIHQNGPAWQRLELGASGSNIVSAKRTYDLEKLDGRQSVSGSTNFRYRYDWVTFQLDNQSHVKLALSELQADVDLYLLDSVGRFIASSTNEGNFGESIAQELSAGTYRVLVYQYSGFSTQWHLELSADPSVAQPDGAGKAGEQALELGFGEGRASLQDFAGSVDRQDQDRFGSARPAEFSQGLISLSADIDVYLSTEPSEQPNRSANGSTGRERVTATLAAGTYFVRVTSGTNNSSDTLALAADRQAPPEQDQPNDSGQPLAELAELGSNPENLNASEASETAPSGQGMNLAVIQTKGDFQHPDLWGTLWVDPREIPSNRLQAERIGETDIPGDVWIDERDPTPSGRQGTNTPVAGLLAVQGLASSGGGCNSVAQTMPDALNNGANPIALRLGESLSQAIDHPLAHAEQQGGLVVSAAVSSRGLAARIIPGTSGSEPNDLATEILTRGNKAITPRPAAGARMLIRPSVFSERTEEGLARGDNRVTGGLLESEELDSSEVFSPALVESVFADEQFLNGLLSQPFSS